MKQRFTRAHTNSRSTKTSHMVPRTFDGVQSEGLSLRKTVPSDFQIIIRRLESLMIRPFH